MKTVLIVAASPKDNINHKSFGLKKRKSQSRPILDIEDTRKFRYNPSIAIVLLQTTKQF